LLTPVSSGYDGMSWIHRMRYSQSRHGCQVRLRAFFSPVGKKYPLEREKYASHLAKHDFGHDMTRTHSFFFETKVTLFMR
jgi:hypothetical protein